MAQTKDWSPTQAAKPVGDSDATRKILFYAVRQAGRVWHWEVRRSEELIDIGIANSVANARVMAFLRIQRDRRLRRAH